MLDGMVIGTVRGDMLHRRWSVAETLRIVSETQELGVHIGEMAARQDAGAVLDFVRGQSHGAAPVCSSARMRSVTSW